MLLVSRVQVGNPSWDGLCTAVLAVRLLICCCGAVLRRDHLAKDYTYLTMHTDVKAASTSSWDSGVVRKACPRWNSGLAAASTAASTIACSILMCICTEKTRLRGRDAEYVGRARGRLR